MKNIIYLTILAILIVLSSCKSNSFSSRRYTHFSKGHKNVSIKEGVAVNNNKVTQPSINVALTNEETAAVSAAASSQPLMYSDKHVATRTQVSKPPYKFHALPLGASANGLVKTTDLNNTNTVVHQKLNKQSKHTFRAIIGEILGFVLWVIMLAVLVFAIIILVLIL